MLKQLLHRTTGPLTRTLEQKQGGHGLGRVPLTLAPESVATSVCGYCSTGCALRIHLKGGAAVGLTPETAYPVNSGTACPKGWEALAVLDSPDRATTPLLRTPGGKLAPVDWDTAMQTMVDRFKSIQQKYGPDSLAWLGTGQIATEELMFLGSLAKFGMGIRHGDGNTRQCMATAVTAYKQSFGFDAPPYTYQDLEESDVIVLVGSNLAIAHPILWHRVLRNPHNPHIVVVDPRRTETAVAATTHLPVLPKGDLSLLYSIAHVLVKNDWIDRAYVDAHTTGFEGFVEHLAAYAPAVVEPTTGIPAADVERIARIIHEGKRVSFWWTMGVNQSHEGTRTAQAIINLALMTGNMGRPGTGANSVTGQCNAMGSRLFSNTTNLLGGHDFAKPEHRAKVANILGIDESRIPDNAGLAYDQIIDGIATGKIKGLWIIGTNPFHSWIGQNDFRRMLAKLEFLVVQDMYHTTESAQAADLVLPAAGWGEKEGTLINSERRIGRIRKVRTAPGQALADFAIFKLLAHYWGCDEIFKDWNTPEDVFKVMTRLSAGQPCDITGITGYEMIDRAGGIQWPYPSKTLSEMDTHRRLFEDGTYFTGSGRALFVYEKGRLAPELTSRSYPFTLLTGRGSATQWHTQTRTGKSAVLSKLHPKDLYVELNPADAKQYGITPDAPVLVETQRGRAKARALITPTVAKGQLFLPMHYEGTNRLTDPVFDPHSRQPAYKSCAARVSLFRQVDG